MRLAVVARAAKWGCSLGLVAVLAVAACDANPRTRSEPPGPSPSQASGPPASTTPVPVSTSTCPTTAQLGGSAGLPEQQGVGDGATLWALFFPTQPELTVGQELKVVWRMTGSGDLSISATGPDGTVVQPVWGPEQHTGSNWQRPGDEWGTGWVFPAAGCWTVNAKRTSVSGYLVLRVAG